MSLLTLLLISIAAYFVGRTIGSIVGWLVYRTGPWNWRVFLGHKPYHRWVDKHGG